jgi:hypothetical protein
VPEDLVGRVPEYLCDRWIDQLSAAVCAHADDTVRRVADDPLLW